MSRILATGVPFHKPNALGETGGAMRKPLPGRSHQHAYGGGSFYSERQRKYLFATHPAAAHAWAHDMHTTKAMWATTPKGAAGSYKRLGPKAIAKKGT